MKAKSIFSSLLALTLGGCLFGGDGTQGLPCNTDTECGGTQKCIEFVCGGPEEVATGVALTSGSSEASSGADEAPMTTDDDDVRTQCEPSETECLDGDTLRECTDGKLSTRDCNGWCGQGAAHNGCQTAPDGDDECFCLNPTEPCTTEGEYQCDGDNYTHCVEGFADPVDCDTQCISDGYAAGVDYCGLNEIGDVTCWCFGEGSSCEDGASRCLDSETSQECWGGQWQNYDCAAIECPAGTYSRGCTYFAGDTEGCGCWPL